MQRTYLYSGTAEHPVFADVLTAEGESRKPPIVMIHGGFHNGTAYLATPDGREGWAVFFSRRGHDVYVMDWPGHGRSPTTAAFLELSMADVGRSLGVLLQEIGPAIVFAHSAGGPIAWWVAENYRAHVAAVVGIAPGAPANLVPALPAEPTQTLDEDAASHPIYAPTDRPAFVDRAFMKEFWANSPRFPHGAFEAYARSIGHESPRILNERFNIGGSGLYLERPEQLNSLPMLVFTGDADPRHPKEVDGALARFLGADFIWLPDLGITGNGHMLMIEDNHEQLAGCISCWLDKKGL
ncbi:Pimeloyl-ACP methyl ester carboxylesterase [Polaromonas sp. OV174]|uniref:alpha/beta fold hydrolase n=1 Tax=Polaromonas sp. OV174 TaxID=1855300 RepID=UPI0008E33BE3|nr:alpha/beta fold hydrolase [Polaromonas sp. OV174]SFC49923.1 Pimeloyl-ACP methyl ester carboxylesterase [Polaromonas sp. OV174]